MVSEQEAQSPARADGETRCPCEVILGDRRPFFLVVIANVVGGDSANDRFHLPAISIIDKTRRRRAGDGNEAVFSIVGHRDRQIGGVVGVAGVVLSEAGELFGFGDDAAARIVGPHGQAGGGADETVCPKRWFLRRGCR